MARTRVTGREISDGTVENVDLSDDLVLVIYKTKRAGWSNVNPSDSASVDLNDVVLTTKYEKQSGHIKHHGFIKGIA